METVMSVASLRESMDGVNGYLCLMIITPEQSLESKFIASKWLPVASVIGKGLFEPSDIFWAEYLYHLYELYHEGWFFYNFF